MLINLDDERALDLRRAGAKAAGLAAARRAGIATLAGIVLGVEHSLPVLAAAERTATERGDAAARLEVMAAPLAPAVVSALVEAAATGFGERLVVRSSSPLEQDPHWSGAFSSYLDVGLEDLATAVRGCWASLFSRDARERLEHLGRRPGSVGMAVLIQPFVVPAPGGVADADSAGARITVADGDLAGMLQGWGRGDRAEVPRSGPARGAAVGRYGAGLLERVAELAFSCRERLGDDHLEWALCDGECLLLQSRRSPQRSRPAGCRAPAVGPGSAPQLRGEEIVRAARAVARFGGPAGEELVLPWCTAPASLGSRHDRSELEAPAGPHEMPRRWQIAALGAAARRLTAQAWAMDPDQAARVARQTIEAVRSRMDPEALARWCSLHPVDAAEGERLVAAAEAAAARYVASGQLLGPSDAWRLPVATLEEVQAGRPVPATTAVPPGDAWEPFLRQVVLDNGESADGEPASGGIGAGTLLALDEPRRVAGARQRFVLHVREPVPGYAPLLWAAAGLVSSSGSASAHLFDVARSLGVPAVAGIELLPRTAGESLVVAVDGTAGEVAWI